MSWTEKWMCFDNSYFRRTGSADNKELLWLPTDKALNEAPEFKTYFIKYSSDQDAFFRDYATAHKKMSELGCKFNPPGGIAIFDHNYGVNVQYQHH